MSVSPASSLPSIVMLHYVSDEVSLDSHKPWVISKASFVRFLDYLERNNYQTITFKDIVEKTSVFLAKGKKIIITFDDCVKHLWDFAIPELRKRKMTAVFYMPTSQLDGYNVWNEKDGLPQLKLMNSEDINRLVGIGMEVGSHAHHHDFLELKDKEGVLKELSESKAILEDIINEKILTVAYPYGSIPARSQAILKQLNYKYGLAVYAKWHRWDTLRRWVFDDNVSNKKMDFILSEAYNRRRSIKDKQFFFRTQFLPKAYNMYASIKAKIKGK